jgi:hypothetical protein
VKIYGEARLTSNDSIVPVHSMLDTEAADTHPGCFFFRTVVVERTSILRYAYCCTVLYVYIVLL